MRDVRDEAGGKLQAHAPSVVAGALTSTQKAQSNGPLRFHTDRADVLGLLCVRQAGSGGESKVASGVTVRNEILRRRPDLHALLCQPYWRTRENQDMGRSEEHTSELQSIMRISYAGSCWKKKKE